MTTGTTEPPVQLTAYDETPYLSQAYGHTHPDRIATIASLFGVKVQSIKNCRVLEIGCASGMNIIPMASSLPDSHFVGIDLSSRQIAEGNKLTESMGLKNIELKHLNILDVDKTLGSFDYIIAHGIFSWVPENVQDKMFQICSDLLSPNGVAYISYNTFPGWHFRGLIRDMMLYHTASLQVPAERAQQARAVLDFLSQSVPTNDNAYGIMLKNEVELLRQHADAYLLHDHLEATNEPIYFADFEARAISMG